MSTKKLPAGVLTLNARFAKHAKKFVDGWEGPRPSADDVARISALTLASIHENLSAYEFLRRNYAPTVASEPRNPVEHWLLSFLRHPDFTLGLMAELRKHLSKYDAIDRVLYRMSCDGTLANFSDGDLILEVRKLGSHVSDDRITQRRKRWSREQRADEARPAPTYALEKFDPKKHRVV